MSQDMITGPPAQRARPIYPYILAPKPQFLLKNSALGQCGAQVGSQVAPCSCHTQGAELP